MEEYNKLDSNCDFDDKFPYLGFIEDSEFLGTSFDIFLNKKTLRMMFLQMCNNVLEKECNFSKYEIQLLSNYSLKNAFFFKIKKELNFSCVFNDNKISKNFKLDLNSTLIINSFLNNGPIIFKNTIDKNLLPAAKIIKKCFVRKTFQMLIDKDLLFHEFVLNKIRILHKDKEVKDLGDSIFLKKKNHCGLKIYTAWKMIKKMNADEIKKELTQAVDTIKEKNCYQVYLVYPKNKKFKKHMKVFTNKLEGEEYLIKAIPYSLRSVLR